jgi:serine/threonine protein kinase
MMFFVILSNDNSLIFKYNEFDSENDILMNIKRFTGTEAHFNSNLENLGPRALAKSLMKASLEVNPKDHPTAMQMITHPFLLSLRNDSFEIINIIRKIHEEINRTRDDPKVSPVKELQNGADKILKGLSTWKRKSISQAVIKKINKMRGSGLKIDTSLIAGMLSVVHNGIVHPDPKHPIELETVFEEFPEFFPYVLHVAAKLYLSEKWIIPTLKKLYGEDPFWLHHIAKAKLKMFNRHSPFQS